MTSLANTRRPFQNITNKANGSRNDSKIGTTAKPSAFRDITNGNNVRNKSSKYDLFKTKYPHIHGLPPLPAANVHRQTPKVQSIIDIDSEDGNDPLNVTDYVEDMYKTFREQETQASVCPSYMINQPDINEKMRAILIDWLVGVHFQYHHLTADTLYLAISILDRFLTQKPVIRKNLQLLGATCLFIASKYEDIYHIGVDHLVHIGADTYTRDDIYEGEANVLAALDCRISFPTANTFLPRFLKAARAGTQPTNIARYMLDSTLLNYNLLQYRPSQLAAAAVLIARDHTIKDVWTPTLAHYTGYKSHEILPVARAILQGRALMMSEDLGETVRHKFQRHRNGRVADLYFKSTL